MKKMNKKNILYYTSALAIALVIISSTTFAQPIQSKMVFERVKAKNVEKQLVYEKLARLKDKILPLIDNEKIKKALERMGLKSNDIKSFLKGKYNARLNPKNILERLRDRTLSVVNTKLANVDCEIKDKIIKLLKVKFDLLQRDIMNLDVFLVLLIGILIAAAWGGGLGTLVLPGVGTIIGAIVSAIGAGNPLTQLAVFVVVAHLVDLNNDLMVGILWTLLTGFWPITWILFFIIVI